MFIGVSNKCAYLFRTYVLTPCIQAHDSAIRHMVWNHNDTWMISGDHNGFVKYWQSNMNNVKMFQAHKEAIRQMRYDSMATELQWNSEVSSISQLNR